MADTGAASKNIRREAFGGYGKETEEHGSKFTKHQTDDSGCRGEIFSFFQGDPVDDEDGSDPYQLLKELGTGRDAGFLEAVVVAAYTGVAGAEGHRDGHDAQQIGAACFVEQADGKKIGVGVDYE